MTTIALEGMRFFAYHGVYEEEQERGTYFEVDVYLEMEAFELPVSDEIEDAPDYAKIYEVVAAVMAERKNLLETLVHQIGTQVKAKFPEANRVRVRVSKEKPPLKGETRRAVVEHVF